MHANVVSWLVEKH